MSLVEKAIAKLRGSEVPPQAPVRAVNQRPPVAVIGIDLEDTAKHRRLLDIDVEAMRMSGYLPEQTVEKQFAERYRQIKRPLVDRAATSTSHGELDPRVIMITSALPGEGKTFNSVNLAFSLARERDISLLLVDADILKPNVSEIFGVKQEPGLMNALTDEALPVESLVIGTSVKGLSILPAGQYAEGASELLLSNHMKQILQQLLAANPRRIILLDSPPLLITSESRALMKVAGQTVLVVRIGQTPVQAVKDALGLIGDSVLGGVMLNEARLTLTESFYGYGTYGSYGNEKKQNP